MILSAAGAVDHDRIVDEASALFGHLRPVVHAADRGCPLHPRRTARGARSGTGAFRAGFEAPGYRDPDFYTAQIFATALGGGMSSRLFQKLREEKGLCYSIFAQAGAYEDTGMMTIYAGTGAGEIAELAGLTIDEMKRSAEDMSEAEVARAARR
jgi:predicted Zn-dependent peptidase